MESTAPGAATKPYLFPSLGPALMISMGYIDLGKWVAAVDGGVRFGYDLVLPVLFFNFTAILCQYLATRIGMVTGKNLAEMCSEEYSRSSCMLLGVQAELSMITSDLTMILGIAHGLNLLFDIDLITCICFASVAAIFLPHFITTLLQDNQFAEALYVGIAGFALLCYVFGVLVSQPEIPLVMNVMFPKLSGESAYSLMALLGANIMAHNFYIHSSVVQQQRKPNTVAIGALFHDHLFAVLFIFTGIFLVNYVLMNSAAAVSSSAEVLLSFQDVFLLMDQIFKTAIAPVLFFLVLLFASQINALTSNIGGKVILKHLFGMNLSVSAHHLLVKVLTFIPALYSAKVAGAEGTYQLLIFCQVVQAMVLPSSVIPLFRIASSRLIMGAFKISWCLEVLALFAFLGMLASNIIFIIEMLFGNSGWINNIKGSTGSNFVVPYTVLLLISCASIAFTLYLAATPLKSASEEPDNQLWTFRTTQKNSQELSESREVNNTPENIEFDDDQVSMVESNLDNLVESHPDKSTVEYQDLSEAAVESDQDSKLSIDGTNTRTITCPSPTYLPEEPKLLLEESLPESLPEIRNNVSPGNLPDSIKVETGVEAQAEVPTAKENDEVETLDSDKSLEGTFPTSTTDGPGSLTSVKESGSDGFNGSGSLSKISGLGRAARRQYAAILDEFWGNLFDFHGKLTQDASRKKLDVLLGLDLRVVASSANSSTESSKNPFNDADKGLDIAANSTNFMSPRQSRISNLDLSYGRQIGSSSWAHNMQLPNTQLQNSSTSMLEGSEKLYSNFNLPAYSDTRDYQPATIHGYQLASYLKGSSVGRSPYSSTISPDPQSASKRSSSFMTNYGDSVMYGRGQDALGSLGTSGLQSPTAAQIGRLRENPYYNPSLVEPSESVGSGAYTKKYHTSPDMSALIAASRSSLLNEGNWGGPIGPQPSLSRMASERSQYANSISRTGFPLPFDQLSPPRLDRDVFSLQSNLNLNPDSKSLWSTQPFEQLFGVTKMDQSRGDGRIGGVARRVSTAARQTSYAEAEAKLLQSLRFCITKLLKLEGSEWLFRQNGGCDEELLDRVASAERCLQGDTSEINQIYMGDLQHFASPDQKFGSVQRSEDSEALYGQPLPNCGDNCVWRAALVISFGVWCVRRILELSLAESRPELWGKYTYVLNRLQGILDQAFCKPRLPLVTCSCIELSGKDRRNLTKPLQNGQSLSALAKQIRGSFTTASNVLDIIKDVETAVSGRKGRTGTAAGDVAFPKGKENLASVLKRYKRRLSNKSSGAHEGASSRKAASSGSSVS